MILDVKVQELVSVKHKYAMASCTVLMDQMKLIVVRLYICMMCIIVNVTYSSPTLEQQIAM